MPNHIHFLISILGDEGQDYGKDNPNHTLQNSLISRFVSTFKRFCNKEYGENIWQYRSHDHIIRNLNDYNAHLAYIAENPKRWEKDNMFIAE